MNKRGLASGLIAVMLVLFLFGVFSLLGLTAWNQVNDTIQNLDNNTVSQPVKDKIDDLSSFMNWGDKFFILIFVAMFLGFIITSFTLPTNQSVFFMIYMMFLVFISILAMILSNSWHYLVNNINFIEAAASLPFTDWFMNYQPIVVFVTGLVGGIIFYARKNTNPIGGSGANFDFEGEGGEGL